MKPWEEDWDAVGTSVNLGDDRWAKFEFNTLAELTDPNSYAATLARAKLAAQAPVMARRLLAWTTECGCKQSPACPDCEADRAVLRSAGVLP